MTWMALALAGGAGLAGAAGVALAAAAAHSGASPNLAIAANMLLLHAVPVLAIALRADGPRPLLWLIAAALLLAGATLFSSELAMGALANRKLFPMAAPTGGTTMIAGWLMITIAAIREALA